MKIALTVAGSDSGGGAGIQADMLAIAANGVFATSAITAITAQNPDGVSFIEPISPQCLKAQLEAVYTYFKPQAAKTGMIFSEDIAKVCVEFFKNNRDIALVVDPVMISTSGSKLLDDSAIKILIEKLAPLAKLVTPNLHEARHILNCPEIGIDDMDMRACQLCQKLKAPVLLKGGHLQGCAEIVDVLAIDKSIYHFKSKRIEGVDTHGSGCTLSAAIAANLALGHKLETACKNGHDYLYNGMLNPLFIGNKKFINHDK